LEPLHTYQFRVKAVNEEGESEPLETDNATVAKNPFDVPTAPGLPDIVDWDENMVKLKWEPPIRDNGAPITGYIIEMMDKFRGEFVKVCINLFKNCMFIKLKLYSRLLKYKAIFARVQYQNSKKEINTNSEYVL